MNFQQYISQKNPIKHYSVSIGEGDCTQIYNVLPNGNKVIVLNIDDVLYSYLLTPESSILYSMDNDGNKKCISCFRYV
jgi:hypothetical protein